MTNDPAATPGSTPNADSAALGVRWFIAMNGIAQTLLRLAMVFLAARGLTELLHGHELPIYSAAALPAALIVWRAVARFRQVNRIRNPWTLDGIKEKEMPVLATRRSIAAPDSKSTPTTGIGLSGGGLRAALLGLGFLRAMDDEGMLRETDYLSTVSGGSWAGGAFVLGTEEQVEPAHGGAATKHNVVSSASWDAIQERFVKGYLGNTSSDIAGLAIVLVLHLVWAVSTTILLVFCGFALVVPFVWLMQMNLGHGLEQRTDPLFQNPLLPQIMYFGRTTEPVSIASALLPCDLALALAVAAATALGISILLRRRGTANRFLHAHGAVEVGKLWVGYAAGVLIALVVWLFLAVFPWHGVCVGGLLALLPLLLVVAAVVFARSSAASPNIARGFRQSAIAAAILTVVTFVGCSLACSPKGCFAGADLAFRSLQHVLDVVAPGTLRIGLDDQCFATIMKAGNTSDAGGAVVARLLLGSLVVGVLIVTLSSVVARVLGGRTSLGNPHRWWRTKISEGFFGAPAKAALTSRAPWAPIHLINVSFDARSSMHEHLVDGGGMLTFGSVLSGSEETGYVESTHQRLDVDYLDAITTSAAVVHVVFGSYFPRILTVIFALLHVRLGRWVENPRYLDRPPGPWVRLASFAPVRFLREFVGRLDETARYLQVADGGHEENLGLVTLVRRGCKRIYVLDSDTDTKGKGIARAFDTLGWAAPSETDLRGPRLDRVEGDVHVTIVRLAGATTIGVEALAEIMKIDPPPLTGKFPLDSTINQWINERCARGYVSIGGMLAREALKAPAA